MSNDTAWLTLAALGAYHGVNPAMGWLFAVSRGLTERRRSAVWRSLVPIAIGHELSIAVVALVVLGLSVAVDPGALHLVAAIALVAFGIFRFVKPRAHPRWTTMRVSDRELTLWSFLMSSAHGAGLMVAPVLIGLQDHLDTAHVAEHQRADLAMVSRLPLPQTGLGILLHVGVMLLVMGAVAIVVYERVGLEILRRAWINTDHLWAGAFLLAGVVTFLS
jgi:hypothetical protein